MDTRAWVAANLTARLLAEPWTPSAIADAVNAALGAPIDWRRQALIDDLFGLAYGTYPPSPRALTTYLTASEYFRPRRNQQVAIVLDPPVFAPLNPFLDLPIPALATLGDLAAWLNETPQQLDWLSDDRRGHGKAANPHFRHYRYALVPKHNGKPRLIEAPKPRLKAIQRKILKEILSAVPVHPGAHGFVAGRSCLTTAQIHAHEDTVLTLDLAQFFPTIGLPRIHGLFRALGYPWAVARRLAGLCTTITPRSICARLPDPVLFGVPHLPQGAPTSPSIANLLAWTLDLRLDGLARAAGANYTRYADDLAFSGDAAFGKTLPRFQATVGTIVREEGFALNQAKTRIMPASARQRVTGIVVNEHCNIARSDYDTLKAILHNCFRLGPATQNRARIDDFRAHLEGRIGWVEQVNPARAAKLRTLFERIAWPLQDAAEPPES